MNCSKIIYWVFNRSLLLLLLFSGAFSEVKAQHLSKPSVGPANYGNWPYVNWPYISNNGAYAMYTLHGNAPDRKQQLIRSTKGAWQRTIDTDTASGFFFSGDNCWLIYRSERDNTLRRLRLGTQQPATSIAGPVLSFKTTKTKQWLACRLKDTAQTLLLEDFISGDRQTFTSVREYNFSPAGKYLLMVTEERAEGLAVKRLALSTPGQKPETIWASRESISKPDIEQAAFGPDERQLAFLVQYGDSTTLCHTAVDGSKKLLSSATIRDGFSLATQRSPVFSNDGKRLFLYLKKAASKQVKAPDTVDLDIWRYRDEWTPRQQPAEEKSSYLAVLHVDQNSLTVLEMTNDTEANFGGDQKYLPVGKYVIAREEKYLIEHYWQPDYYNHLYLVSTKDGSRQLVPKNNRQLILDISLSPDERFVTWYNNIDHHYYSYEIATGQTRDISAGLPYAVHDDSKTGDVAGRFGNAGWLGRYDRYLIYDRFDIWGLDPSGQRPPLNLTCGYGRRSGLVLALAEEKRHNGMIISGDTLLLSGFNRQTKENGFFTLVVDKNVDPKQRCFGPYTYFIPRSVPDDAGVKTINENYTGERPLKAAQTNAYIVKRMTAESSPNYFFTKDFKTFRAMSEVYPERDYNWLRSELVHWTLPDGRPSMGILYKPENFDPEKKYPVIFYYYREKSDGLHMYMQPEKSAAYINIPQYVSNGYLVFVPDISPQQGSPGKSALESVESAAKYLSNFPWVNKAKLGITGQSYGGFETNYIVAHSSLFAAACSGSGSANLTSHYGGLHDGSGSISQRICETGQYNLGASLGARPDIYVENSPVIKVQGASTPLLIWQGAKDELVAPGQAIEMYLSMRRAGKKVWLLMYNNEGHGTIGKSAEDLDIRMRQFFDHYLKDVPPPKWMTQGRPTRLKGIDDRLAPDNSGMKP